MAGLLKLIFQLELSVIVLFLLIFIVVSILENEKTAIKRTLLILAIVISILIVQFLLIIPVWVITILTVLITSVFIIVMLPFGDKKVQFEIPENKYDERDIMFSRMELEDGTEKYIEYYQNRPENKIKDDLFRNEPGLLSPKSKLYSPFLYKAAAATFSTVELLHPLVETKKNEKNRQDYSADKVSVFIKNWALKLGASEVGFTGLKAHHIYSHIGRGNDYGKELVLNHKYAIAFTVEMSYDSLKHAPQGTSITESSQQYLNAGTIAVQIAQFIRNLGYDARAHIDANYRLICPVVAMDAGLGTIGRMGLLMTAKHGPRVRIGVVTTNLELTSNKKSMDSSVIHFCEICKKCAVNCPSNSISFNSSKNGNNYKRWTINHEACFMYWTKVGTDCGRCIAVCPYAHKNNLFHNMVRHSLKINSFNRWLALKLDNFFYTEKPTITPLKKWMSPK